MLNLRHHQFDSFLIAEGGGKGQRYRLCAGIFTAGLKDNLVFWFFGEGIEVTNGIGMLDEIDDIESQRQ